MHIGGSQCRPALVKNSFLEPQQSHLFVLMELFALYETDEILSNIILFHPCIYQQQITRE